MSHPQYLISEPVAEALYLAKPDLYAPNIPQRLLLKSEKWRARFNARKDQNSSLDPFFTVPHPPLDGYFTVANVSTLINECHLGFPPAVIFALLSAGAPDVALWFLKEGKVSREKANFYGEWRETTYSAAAHAANLGHLGLLKFLILEGDEIPMNVVEHALIRGSIPVLEWLWSMGVTENEDVIHAALRSGTLASLQFLRKKGVKFSQDLAEAASYPQNVRRWLVKTEQVREIEDSKPKRK